MTILKRIGIGIFILAAIQAITFYAVGEKSLIQEVARNHESYVLPYPENHFDNIGVVSNLNPSSRQLNDFKLLASQELKICKQYLECKGLEETENFYIYCFDLQSKNPFYVNSVKEHELADEFGAWWTSRYVWVLFKWVLIEKVDEGVT